MKKLVLILLLILGISINLSFHNMLNAQEIKNKTIAIELTNIPKNSFNNYKKNIFQYLSDIFDNVTKHFSYTQICLRITNF